jgi:hypothetical protein
MIKEIYRDLLQTMIKDRNRDFRVSGLDCIALYLIAVGIVLWVTLESMLKDVWQSFRELVKGLWKA